MFLTLAFVLGAGPEIEVVNKCPPAVVVVNKCPAPKAVRVVKPAGNGFNCSASFCGANGGPGCGATGRTCPNNVGGQCVCGNAPAKVAVVPEAVATPPTPAFLLPAGPAYSTCPSGGCPQSQPAGRFRLFR